jgi:hypothetical protein
MTQRVRGGSRLRRQLRRLGKEPTEEIGRVFREIGPELEDAIRAAAPVDEGRLAAAAHHRVSNDALGVVAGYGQRPGFKRLWLKGGFEALWQEFGARQHAAQPFISPTFRRLLPGMLERIERAVSNVIERVSRS